MLKINIEKKAFSNKIILENINLTIKKNGIYGVVGKNGEGKTTFFKIVNSLIDFKGTVEYNFLPIKTQDIAFFPTEVPIYDELTAAEFSLFYRALLNLKKDIVIPNLFDVPQDKLVKTFSTGMKKKAYMNAVLQKEYLIYIFDEPFNGLDLESNYLLINQIRKLSKNSIVFVSSHILEILFKNCDKIFLIKDTKLKEFEIFDFKQIENELFLNN